MQTTNRNRSKSVSSTGKGPDISQAAKLFVGGLSYDTTDASLQRYFEEFGEVESAVVLRDPTTSRSRGFGFVTFVSTDSANMVVSSTRHLIDGRKVEAKFAVPRSASTGSTSDQQQSRGSPIHKPVDPRSPSSPTSPSPIPYSAAVTQTSALNFAAVTAGRSKSGSSLDAGVSTSGSVRSDSFSDIVHKNRTGSHGDESLGDGNESIGSGSRRSRTSNTGRRSKQSSGIISNKIFVGGLLYATHHGSLRSFFEQYGPVETAEVIYNRDTKKSRGFGFVVFQEYEPVAKVLADQANNLISIDGKQVEVKRCVARQESGGSKIGSESGRPRGKSSPKLGESIASLSINDDGHEIHDNQWHSTTPSHSNKSFASVAAGEHNANYSPSMQTRSAAHSSNSHEDFYLDDQFNTDEFYLDEESVYRNERATSSSSNTSFFNAYGSPRNDVSRSPFQNDFSPRSQHDVPFVAIGSPTGLQSPLPPLSLDGFHATSINSCPTPTGLDGNIWGNSGSQSMRSPSNSSVQDGEFSQYGDIRSSSLFSLDEDPQQQQLFGQNDYRRDTYSSIDSTDNINHFNEHRDLTSFLNYGETQQQK